jgi:hypothetical protein
VDEDIKQFVRESFPYEQEMDDTSIGEYGGVFQVELGESLTKEVAEIVSKSTAETFESKDII